MNTLDKLEKLLGDATPGPLEIVKLEDGTLCILHKHEGGLPVIAYVDLCGVSAVGPEYDIDSKTGTANANLITTAINTLPALIEVARAMEILYYEWDQTYDGEPTDPDVAKAYGLAGEALKKLEEQ